MPGLSQHARKILKEQGFPPLKWIQEEVIASLLSGQDTLALLPTGTGKSLCFQVPAILTQRPTLVISPLLALMQDQVAQLTQRGIRSAHWSSLSSPSKVREIREQLRRNHLQLLYLSPEKLASRAVFPTICQVPWGVLAVDEAHCVSAWGESFRPHYQALGAFLSKLHHHSGAVRFACTATATASTLQKIQTSLELSQSRVIAVPNLRPNLQLAIVSPPSAAASSHLLFRLLQQWWESDTGSALVYVSTRRDSERLAAWLQNTGLPARAFHAGLARRDKLRLLQDFSSAQRSLFVSTCALGMGVDQPAVRLVIHAQSPTDVESYVQEVGRAGRDGKPAKAVWLYRREQLLETLEQRRQHTPHLWSDMRRDGQAILRLAESRRCITDLLQGIFASAAIPHSCLWQCGCNRCHSDGWLIRPARQNFGRT